MARRPKKGSWVVKVSCEVIKEVICEGCTEEEAEKEPFKYSVDERELGTTDWKVIKVDPND